MVPSILPHKTVLSLFALKKYFQKKTQIQPIVRNIPPRRFKSNQSNQQDLIIFLLYIYTYTHIYALKANNKQQQEKQGLHLKNKSNRVKKRSLLTVWGSLHKENLSIGQGMQRQKYDLKSQVLLPEFVNHRLINTQPWHLLQLVKRWF